MGLAVGYMGTKRHLAPFVAEVTKVCKPGPILDAFSGMCAVGEAVGTARCVWNNDVQHFAHQVAHAFFGSNSSVPTTGMVTTVLYANFDKNRIALSERFEKEIAIEDLILANSDFDRLTERISFAKHVGNDSDLNAERRRLAASPSDFPYRLSSITFANGYFGIKQSIEIDSIRYCIDAAFADATIDDDERRWLLIALCQSATRIASTTGHFAQYLKPNQNNFKVLIKQRKKSVWETWVSCIALLTPVGTKMWRNKNKFFNEDALSLLRRANIFRERPAVIYADPPYTDDQYSRYYHVWETLMLYDYPESSGAGRYRPNRFLTPFSQKSGVKHAMEQLVAHCKALNSDLIMSYPANGLLVKAGVETLEILRGQYKNVEVAHSFDYEHSTMGASKGAASHAVKELIYLARNR